MKIKKEDIETTILYELIKSDISYIKELFEYIIFLYSFNNLLTTGFFLSTLIRYIFLNL